MAAYSYSYRVPGLQKVSADVAGAECQRLDESEQGLSPVTLLDASRDERAPLHGEFEWRDDVAAEKYRLDQAAGIIRNIVIVPVTTEDAVPQASRAFVCTPGGKSVYVSMQSAMTNDDYRNHLLSEARKEMGYFAQKYRRLTELAGVMAAIDEVLEKGTV